jgi:hypothetical protein
MSIKVGVISNDLDKQILLLREYPKIVNKHFRPALKEAGQAASAAIRPGIPVESGKAQRTFNTRVTGSGVESASGKGGIQAQVGWWGRGSAWYINVVEYGARAHDLTSGADTRKKKNRKLFDLAYNSGGMEKYGKEYGLGHPVYIRGAGWKTMQVHKGFPGRGFLRRGAEAAQPVINALMSVALDGVARELCI